MVLFHLIFKIRYVDFTEIESEFIEQFKNELLERLDIDYFNFSIEYFNNLHTVEYHFYTFDNFETNSIGLLIEDLRDCFQQLELVSTINVI
jgi:hypothetical protein